MPFVKWPKGMPDRRLFLVVLATMTGAVVVWRSSFETSVMRVDGSSMNGRTLESTPHGSKFCVVYDFWRAAEPFRSGAFVTLVLHASADYLRLLEEQMHTWTGTVSVAVFIAPPRPSASIVNVSESQLAFKAVFAALTSSSHLAATGRIALHLFFVRPENDPCPRIFVSADVALHVPTVLSDLHDFRSESELYPINTARNIARNGAHTELFISGDIEQVYVAGFERRMFQLGHRVLLANEEQTVLVHRRFELAKGAPMPNNKSELLSLWQKGLAVEFHKFVFPSGHHIPMLKEWFSVPETPTARIQRRFRYFDADWEPQFVGDYRVPMHWEEFPYRFKTNAHLGSLLCYQNFSFSVTHDLFSVHRGIQRAPSIRNVWLHSLGKQLGLHRVLRDFQRMLHRSAPEMTKSCPRIS